MSGQEKTNVVPLQITPDLSILEVLQAYPQVRQVFYRYGMGCLECMGAINETIASGARSHGVNLENLLKDLNKAIRSRG
ncbi:MAG: hypothetical protein PWR22_252 [Moorella sp. (in: firmicutes)]|jgi:hybrid cluster-associated redox disulfide protein|uniref:DUF1858 domain-containing protein n=1 Tax=unclassified Neomoorella TaxID=2676739 RepID=UPI0010FFC25C|nr:MULTISPECIES: DUF1858 domain-containing protein [unclassified Moorella (in: firmicutes)]MDK2815624.1 hypothetical protein [Moorella sp. (in: firmicutes)]MDK2894190.1 hypothetical protein [Moorella sp. (in: firmicutes)]GEA15103.1 hypothetical protein E308F_13470 [Moorella sp. E308F]GEA16986.1 hypothetical protein E306M_01200 [Moorella sp. E306M]